MTIEHEADERRETGAAPAPSSLEKRKRMLTVSPTYALRSADWKVQSSLRDDNVAKETKGAPSTAISTSRAGSCCPRRCARPLGWGGMPCSWAS